MKNLTQLFLLPLLLITAACKKTEQQKVTQPGHVKFGMVNATKVGSANGKPVTLGEVVPAFVLLSITDAQGKAIETDKKIALYAFGGSFVSESLSLKPGNYKLGKFLVLDAANKIIYASPLSGSPQAQYVNNPLPLGFSITENGSTLVTPQVLKVEADTPPESFGYVSFGFEVIDATYIPLRLMVKAWIGEFLYERRDAKFIITAYSTTKGTLVKEFNYSGSLGYDIVLIKDGYDYYEIKTQNWGGTDMQEVSHDDLMKYRADGPTPGSFGFGDPFDKQKKSLQYYIEYLEQSSNIMTPSHKTSYTYNSNGRVEYAKHHNYNTNTAKFEPATMETFIYDPLNSTRVSKIYTYSWNAQLQNWETTAFKEITYEYLSSTNYKGLSTITEKNMLSGITTIASFQFSYNSQGFSSVTYSFSNGVSFIYNFKYALKNIIEDKTINGGELCNTGTYQYDNQINPFKHLGYIDMYLQNFSAGNKLTENVNYTGCSYPSLKPLSYDYQYDQDGYPTVKITHYSNGKKGKTAFYY